MSFPNHYTPKIMGVDVEPKDLRRTPQHNGRVGGVCCTIRWTSPWIMVKTPVEIKSVHELEEACYSTTEGVLEKVFTLGSSWNELGISPVVLKKSVAKVRCLQFEGRAWVEVRGIIEAKNALQKSMGLQWGMI